MWFVYVDYTNDGRPFYVGKGDVGRVKRQERNSLHQNIARKHGQRREVEFASSVESLVLAVEIDLIAEYKTQHGLPECWGANLTAGGEGLSNPSPEVRRKMSEAQLKRPAPSVDTRQKMSECALRWNAVPENKERKRQAMKRVIRSAEHRANISRVHQRPVEQLDMQGNVIASYPSGMAAEKATGISRTKICMCCKGTRPHSGGYSWRYKV